MMVELLGRNILLVAVCVCVCVVCVVSLNLSLFLHLCIFWGHQSLNSIYYICCSNITKIGLVLFPNLSYLLYLQPHTYLKKIQN